MKILLVWEEVPENTSTFLIEDPLPELQNILLSSAGAYINLVNCPDDHPIHQLNERWDEFGIAKYKVDNLKPIAGPIDYVVVCGFIM